MVAGLAAGTAAAGTLFALLGANDRLLRGTLRKLKAEGYEDVRQIDTTDGRFMGGSTLLLGRK